MEKDSVACKRKKNIDDSVSSTRKCLKNCSGSDEENEELFSWEEYLKKCHAKAVPKETFKHVQDTKVQGFVPGMKLESLDRTSLETDTYWVATVVMSSGPLLLLRYDGYDDDRSGDFWCDAASEDLQPIGWCARTNNILIPPVAIRHKESNWAKFLMQDLKTAVCAPDHLFHRVGTITTIDLMYGTKLVDLICRRFEFELSHLLDLDFTNRNKSATVILFKKCFLDNHLPVIYYYFLSGYLVHPFCWETYLEWTSSSAAPESLFNLDIPSHEFDIGMKCEAVDQTNPSIMTVATVTQVVGRTMWVLLDGYKDDSIEHIYDVQSFDLFPVGWCSMNGHPLLTPRVQRPPEENKRLASLRVMKQKEIKKSAADSNISNTTSALNISSDTAEDLSTLDMDRGEKVEKAALLNSTDATVVTNSLSPPASSEDLKSLAKFETILNKERKLKEPSSQDSLESILSTPKGKYELRASTLIPRDYGSKDGEEVDEDMEKDNAEVVIDLTEDEDTIQATGLRIFVRNKCEHGPLLNKSKLANVPAVIGPENPFIVLKKLVEQIVLCADSPKEVCKLLATERDKMPISKIVKTLKTKLSLCENLISINRIAVCTHCDVVKAPLSKPLNSPHKLKEPTSTPKILENTKVVKPVITKQEISEGSGKVTSKLMRETVPFPFPSRVSPKHSKLGSQGAATSHESKHITKWTVSEVGDYISSTDCFKFADLFMREEIDGRALTLLSLDEIHKCLGVTLGPAIKLQNNVKSLLKKQR
ncbi:PREDICTED: scm-like with four MBT domains protein 2 [Acropora digitifera]|uniref:scm-like with four MBT domains protein 2 n=1 Tax=Acropora digitifera TaxID=70779 RepID=UPI00077A5049|nr:PREDICTED: scm-like with four MBT domains protein 2 [Acropora digitifera]